MLLQPCINKKLLHNRSHAGASVNIEVFYILRCTVLSAKVIEHQVLRRNAKVVKHLFYGFDIGPGPHM